MTVPTKILLDEASMPKRWYNLVPDLPAPPPPPLHPATHEPVGPDDLAPLFPMALIGQEVSSERYIEIPEAVQEVYRLWRPSPLYRAHRLEKALGTPARIYYKYEGVSPAGSHPKVVFTVLNLLLWYYHRKISTQSTQRKARAQRKK
jgi:tryptophan synthase beta chain